MLLGFFLVPFERRGRGDCQNEHLGCWLGSAGSIETNSGTDQGDIGFPRRGAAEVSPDSELGPAG